MVFYCPLCRDNVIFLSTLCDECCKTRRLVSLYGNKVVIEILENVLLRKAIGIENKTVTECAKYLTRSETKKSYKDVLNKVK